jgi:miniconductance mechanosensitive channel
MYGTIGLTAKRGEAAMVDSIREMLAGLGLGEYQVGLVLQVAALVGIAILAIVVNFVAKKIIVRVVHHIVRRTRTDWDDVLQERKVFTRLSHIAPALVIWTLAPEALGKATEIAAVARRGAEIYMLVVTLLVISGFLDAVNEIYRRFSVALRLPIRGYIQVIKIVLSIAVGVFALSITLDKSPWVFLSGLGAMTAVLLLIFKDAILGLVAGIQLSANDMVRPGDWIEMKKFGADGDVMEVTLTTVKVRNWDKTITTIPTYALISDAFRNWRGMEMSGGRRIKRSVWIDVNSIRFCTPEMVERFSRIHLLREYVGRKQEELNEYNAEHGFDDTDLVNGRRMTNIGTFRAYLVQYLRNHADIHQEMTFLVRQLQPTEKGLPIEIYVFSRDQRWVQYEAIQSDIFDHVLAALPEFGLRPFQSPTGADIAGAVAAVR